MASPIETTWARATVLIETAGGRRGTGFFVGRSVGENQWKIWLVTNKHVLDADSGRRKAMNAVRLHLNIETNGVLAGQIVDYPLLGPNGAVWHEHPIEDIDVLAIDAVPLFDQTKDLANRFAPEDLFALAAMRKELDISAGEEIVTVGYPIGIRQGRTNLPLLRQGIIATRIGEELHEEVPMPGGTRIRRSRAFLIDGATIPGSSGSPVILKPVTGRHQGNAIMMGSTPAVLLGIVAETRFAPINVGDGTVIPGFAGLGFVFEVETIQEVLNLF